MSRDYLHPYQPIRKHGLKLPHWQQDEAMQFVTFRLGDSLPEEKKELWKTQRNAWNQTWPKPWTPEQEADYHRRFTYRLEKWLDAGAGSCLLRDSTNRGILEKILMFDEGRKYEHHAWVIMPNHVHLLFKPLAPLESLIQTWKSISARRIATRPIWQANCRDTMIRDGDHFTNAVQYIRRNPTKARLPETDFTLWQSERALRIS
ncbi:transposase [Luteolibacter yonseiensis]|uniref:Transposase n=1 Tax=Luteolibacter yonseiensis TaxID=1144680 RepID=A0A934VAF0_9BACT|nr:transposase [Luteolibacter yonseiensis]